MTYFGKVLDGKVILPPEANIPNGSKVEVNTLAELHPKPKPETISTDDGPTLAEMLKDYIGMFDDLPDDYAENHDHYIHGTPKQTAK